MSRAALGGTPLGLDAPGALRSNSFDRALVHLGDRERLGPVTFGASMTIPGLRAGYD
ncbi:hypothetical protein [Dinoroseobacter sp. S375]|uniref:hypothetical protein n=1 Tax=Dinoroseobacter sp. S375 TaxID=3415136 RepID=UPI003C7ED103